MLPFPLPFSAQCLCATHPTKQRRQVQRTFHPHLIPIFGPLLGITYDYEWTISRVLSASSKVSLFLLFVFSQMLFFLPSFFLPFLCSPSCGEYDGLPHSFLDFLGTMGSGFHALLKQKREIITCIITVCWLFNYLILHLPT